VPNSEKAKFGEKLAGPGGIETPNDGIKIRLVIQRFQWAFETMPKMPVAFSIAWQLFPNKKRRHVTALCVGAVRPTGIAVERVVR
jgi:hypothetical protein